jgi:pheromone shutdown protein TraB
MEFPQNLGEDGDPRMTGERIREIPGESGKLTLVGCVHDHPASTYRVRRTVETVEPDVLALEIPQIAVPLFEQYAQTDRTPPVFGGEMSAAVQAAKTDRTVGIDRPTSGFFGRLVRSLVRERPSPTTTRKVLSDTVSATKHAVVCRLASAVSARTSVRLEVDSPVIHDIDGRDSPKEQADDEHRQVRQSRAFMNAFRNASATQASRFGDDVREEHMADRLSELRVGNDVVAVVGVYHLDPLAEKLRGKDN